MEKIYFAYRAHDAHIFQQCHQAMISLEDFTKSYEFVSRPTTPDMKEKLVKKAIKAEMKDVALIVVILGQEVRKSPIFDLEVKLAYNQKKKFLVLKIPNTRHQYPSILAGHKVVEVDWDFPALVAALDKKFHG